MATLTRPEVLKYGPRLRGPSVKNEDQVFQGTSRAIRLINSLFYGKNENENTPNTHREFANNFPKNCIKSILKFSENLKTILVNVCFQFCLATESIGKDGAIRPDDQPIKLRESRTG